MNRFKKDRLISGWLFTGAGMIFLMILLGGITRLTGSGLSIVEWNVVSGTLPPLNEQQWNISFEKYKQFPQYKKLNSDMTMNGFKKIFFWEYVHRLWGRIIGMVFIIPLIWFYCKRRITGKLSGRLLLIFLVGLLQAGVGWFMVMSGLVDNPNVSHYRLAIHFSVALMLLYLVVLTAFQTSPYLVRRNGERESGINSFQRIVIPFLIFIQLVYGALVAGMKAGFSFNTFPKMDREWISDSVFTIQPVYINFFENGAALQFVHRWLGVLVFAAILIAWITTLRQRSTGLTILLVLVTFQVVLGITTLLLKVPTSIAVIHQGLGIIIFLTSLIGNHNFKIEKL